VSGGTNYGIIRHTNESNMVLKNIVVDNLYHSADA
jgi:hypothetical protein